MIPVANFGTLALVELAVYVLLPLFYSSPIEIGGLGFDPPIIGTYMGIFGITNGVIQVLFAARIIEWLGPKLLFCWAVLWFYPLILIFPIMSAVVAAEAKVGPITWILIAIQLLLMALMELSYSEFEQLSRQCLNLSWLSGVITMFTTRAAPNKQSLGSTNGLTLSLAAIARAIAPAMTTSLFAFSKEYNVLGGNLVYVILAILVTVLVLLSRRLPDRIDEE